MHCEKHDALRVRDDVAKTSSVIEAQFSKADVPMDVTVEKKKSAHTSA